MRVTERKWEVTLNLRDAYESKRLRRAKRAITLLKEKARRIAKAKSVVIDQSLNEVFWSRSASRPPRRLKVVIEKVDDETAEVKLSGSEG
ncbi:MAG: 60S ribosomal protein L31 [Thaumarchaeota archaeon]|nr:60S ribosomal protein L31 [Candidatus Calditenuaceae archaeon]MDW8042979.1 50S ribosomal protein L31e [Nitrososphaerota archaeon]